MTHSMRSRALAIPAIAMTFFMASPAHAITVEFFEGNNCTQKMLGGFNLNAHLKEGKSSIRVLRISAIKVAGITVDSAQPWNDEARSMRISSNWRNEREPSQGSVAIYDSPQASKKDDWVRVVIRDATQIPTKGVCVGSFERNFDRNGIYLERHPHNGLDGKVSYIISHCDAACRGNLTPDPNPPAPPKPRLVVKPRDPGAKTLSPETARILKQRREQRRKDR